jgi:ribosomal protein S18 acetylase RimI-like enzyme
MSAEQQQQNFIIRTAQESDIAALEAIIAAMGTVKTADYFQRQMMYQQSCKRLVVMIAVDGVDAGYCVLNWDPKYTLFRKLALPEIQDINVLHEFRRMGLASSMIAYCEDLARARGIEHMGISVSVSGKFAPAQRLYAKLGYIPDGGGVTYDRKPVTHGEFRPVDDQLCLMLLKAL